VLVVKRNPSGVRLANLNIENSYAVLAAYLFFKDTLRLKLWLEDNVVMQTFNTLQENGFGILGVKPTTS
jgi:hypothetical protein